MNAEPYSTVREAMRLMQAGDLLAATAAIQQGLRGATATQPASDAGFAARSPLEGTFQVVDEMPLVTETVPAVESPVPSSAPEERPQFSEHTYTGPAGSRRYKLFIPSAYRGQPLPLVVMLHGCTQTPDDFAAGTRMNFLAEERACFVVYPAQPQTANVSKCWNWFETRHQHRDEGEPAIIAGLARELLLTYGLDRERVYVGGLSAGGAMAVVLGRAYPELFAAIGVHSGLPYASAHDMPSAFAAMHQRGMPGAHIGDCDSQAGRRIPAIVFHGDRDVTVHPSNGEKVVNQSAAATEFNGGDRSSTTEETCAGATPGGHSYTRRIFKDSSGNVVAEYWLVHGAAHAWFGGDLRGSFTDPKGPDASKEMMRFFFEHAGARSA